MPTLHTARLTLTPMSPDDAPFMLELLNDPTWIRHIGDRGIRTSGAARIYIENGSVRSFAQHGFGSFLIRVSATGTAIGACGLYRRDYLPAPDIGFALLPRFTGQGYAYEAASATLAFGRATLSLPRVLAIAAPGNVASIKLLGRLGLRFDKPIRIPTGEELSLFTTENAAT